MTKEKTTPELKIKENGSTLETLAVEIERSRKEAVVSANFSVLNMIRIGLLAMQAKQMLPHGKFLPWIADHIPNLQVRSIQKYIKLVNEAADDLQKHLPLEKILSPNFLAKYEKEHDFQREILEGMEQFTLGRTVTELYIEYGILKKNKLDTDGTNNPEGVNGTETPKLPPTPDQQQLLALDYYTGTTELNSAHPESPLGRIITDSIEQNHIGKLPRESRNLIADKLMEAAQRIKEIN